MRNILEELGKRILFFDGGMGTLLQEQGLQPGELPETWNICNERPIIEIHRKYIEAGSDIILTNTFGSNRLKFNEANFPLEDVVAAAVGNVKKAIQESGKNAYIALDIGPTGKLLKPLGTLGFEEAVDIYADVVKAGVRAGADLIHIETMSDTYELKAAVLAAKENSDLPVFATVIFGENQKMLTGASPETVVAMLEGLRVDAIGMNCGLGPTQMKEIFKRMASFSSVPLIVKPNAGLPKSENGKTVFDVSPEEFAEEMVSLVELGAQAAGGCCGTTPDYIRHLVQLCKDKKPVPVSKKERTIVTSYLNAVEIGTAPVIIGERINPTGKSKFKQALRDHDMEYILDAGVKQADAGAHILDVNVGLPEIDEVSMMRDAVTELQGILPLPLQIDTTSMEAMEQAMRIYNGKPMINSVNGKAEVMEQVFPLVKKYGGVVVGLTLDETGIPDNAKDRVLIAEKIYRTAAEYGIEEKDIVIDALTMTMSTDPKAADITLDAVRALKKAGRRTVLGVSNISFGLPQREIINSAFFIRALDAGLSAGIINPNAKAMMQAYDSFMVLSGYDEQCVHYVEKYAVEPTPAAISGTVKTVTVQINGEAAPKQEKQGRPAQNKKDGEMTLSAAIQKGLKEQARKATEELLLTMDVMDIIRTELVAALDIVGQGFEKGTVFLPQLLMSAEAAKAGFEAIKQYVLSNGDVQEKKATIIIATVKGDIHDIGKNIVKVLLENYGYDVIDLGKDVPPEKIVETAVETKAPLVGLSALMTTTVASMEETIKQLREKAPWCKVMVGGAVLTQEYADMIGADFYGKDAMQSVYYAERLLA